jgi:aminodeoxyfutalosine deaminase
MIIQDFIHRMPKVELHVHLEGSIQPATLLLLAERNQVSLPAHTIKELYEWYQFTDFAHFVEIYFAICNCIRTADDMELITREFLKNRAEQNILYSEVIFTPFTHVNHISFDNQLAAINQARKQAKEDLGITINLAPDIDRMMRPVEASFPIADWAVKNKENGIVALGLGGPEIGNPPEVFAPTFQRILETGLPSVPHAGETEGPRSIWGALNSLNAVRIGHGVRCLEDPNLVDFLREKQVPLDVCPSSNVCLGVVPSLSEHPLPKLLEEGLFVTINSDDPSMFNTTLTDEYLRINETFGFDAPQMKKFVFNAVNACLLSVTDKEILFEKIKTQFKRLENEPGLM